MLVLSGMSQDALQALLGEDVTACFSKRVQLEPTLMQISAREHIAATSRRGVTGAAG